MNSNTKAVLRLLVYLTAVGLVACLLSPWMFHLGSWLASTGVIPFLDGFPFHRYFSRTVQISALVLLIPAFLWIGISRFSQLNIEPNPRRWRDLGTGFGLALGPVILLAIAYVTFEIYRLRENPAPATFFRILGTAAAVSVLEEFLFRGVIFGLLLRAMSVWPAAMISSFVFAIVHFMRVARPPQTPPVTWTSGFEQIPLLFSASPPWPLLGWGMLSLLIAGLLLAFVTYRTKSLHLAIGIHAGWILGQQSLQWLARFSVKPPDSLLPWIGPNVVSGAVPTGLISVLVLTVTAALVFLAVRRRGVR